MDIAEWLRTLGLEQYAPAFHDNDVTEDLLPSLTADDLKELGVASVGLRRRLLDAIALLRAAEPAPVTQRPFCLPSRARGVRAAVPSKSASLRPNTLSMVWTNQ